MGRKKLGNVLYAKRLPPEMIERIKSILAEKVGEAPSHVPRPQMPAIAKETPKDKNVMALLDDVERLSKEVEFWKGRFEKAVNASEGQMVAYWRDRAIKAETRVTDLESN